ncbi:MAG: hypothetical protein L3J32_12665 [Rhizobiaceae bacterium]|nr:hypothetical protein [Rhizobiaceae bacterium]
MLQKLEETKLLKWQDDIEETRFVEHLSFCFEGKQYPVLSIFENSYFIDENQDDVVEYHFYTKSAQCPMELVFDRLENAFHIQSQENAIRDIFPLQSFHQAGRNIWFEVSYDQIEFYTAGKEVIFDELQLQSDGTPEDYSDKKYQVYFAIGGKDKGMIDAGYMFKIIPFVQKEDIAGKKYGFNLSITIQQIPEVVDILVAENWSVYQIDSGMKRLERC